MPYPSKDFYGRTVYQNVQIDLDEDMLKKVAQLTGGRYFRATDKKSLEDVYKEIDQLEKVEIEEIGLKEYEEKFATILIAGLLFLVTQIFLSSSVFLRIP